MKPSYIVGGILLLLLLVAGSAYLIYLYINSSNIPPATKTELFTDSTKYCRQQRCAWSSSCPSFRLYGGTCSCSSPGNCIQCTFGPCDPTLEPGCLPCQ